MKARLIAAATVIGVLGASAVAQAQIKLGAILSISGPGAAMGVGYKGAFDFFPSEIAGQKVEYIIRDDATDASTGFTIAQRMISEDHIDAFIGPSLTATDAAVAPLANQAHVPMIAMAPYEYDPVKQPYTFSRCGSRHSRRKLRRFGLHQRRDQRQPSVDDYLEETWPYPLLRISRGEIRRGCNR